MRTLTILLIMMIQTFSLLAEGNGEAHVYIFKPDSSMYQGVKVKAGEISAVTDDSGFAMLSLPEGKQVLILEVEGKKITEIKLDITAGEIAEAMLTLGQQKKALEMEVVSEEEEAAKVAAEDLDVGDKWGNIEGTFTDSKTGKPVVEARVFVRGVNAEANTDENGMFNVKLPIGSYSISVIHPEYATETLDDLKIEEGKVTKISRELLPSAVELDAISVVAVKITGGVAALVEEKRESTTSMEIIGAEQMSKSGDSNAASALKRVTGITVVGGKFVYVRGMGERYSSTLMNGLNLPSPIAERRVVPLDLFPADVIDSLVVQKTSSADRPGEFGGGVVQIRTKKIPEERIFKLGASMGVNSESTNETGLTYAGGDRDFLGMDDGTRDLPAGLGSLDGLSLIVPGNYTDAEKQQIGTAFSRKIWTPENATILPKGSGSFTYGDKFDTRIPFGILATMSYSNSTTNRETPINVYDQFGTANKRYYEKSTTNSIDLGGMFSLGTVIKEDHELVYTALLVRTTDKYARDFTGYAPDRDFIQSYRTSWTEQELENHGFHGDHNLLDGQLNLSWDYATSMAIRDRPFETEYILTSGTLGGNYILDANKSDVARANFSYLEDSTDEYALKAKYSFDFEDAKIDWTIGYSSQDRERDSKVRRFGFDIDQDSGGYPLEGYLIAGNIVGDQPLSAGNFLINEYPNPQGDIYTATQDLTSYFTMWDISWNDMDLNFGVRWEESDQEVITTDFGGKKTANLKNDDTLPSMNFTYKKLAGHQIRFGYAKTVNRPEFKEMSTIRFQASVGAPYVAGGRNIKQAEIENFDLRWEYYFDESGSDSLTLGTFYKDITSPIELFSVTQGAADDSRVYANSTDASVIGLEVDVRKNLSFLKEAWRDYYLSFNMSLVDSEVGDEDPSSFDNPATTQSVTNKNNPLTGQAPVVINYNVGYDNPDSKLNFALLYNYVGERVISRGSGGLDDIILEPYHQLDLVYSQNVYKNWSVKAKIQNIINGKHEETYDGKIVRSYRKGTDISVGLGVKL